MIISKPLLKQTVKSNWKLWTIFTGVLVAIMLIMTVAQGPSLLEMADLTGYDSGGAFFKIVGMIFYNNMALIMSMIYVIITANSLISAQVDRGSMAYTLSTPTKRSTITLTQMIYIISATFMMCLVLMLTNIVGMAISGLTIDMGQILLFNLGLFLIQNAIAGIAYLFSCIFNLSRFSITFGVGVPMFFYIMSIMGQIGGEGSLLGSFKYMTIISLFNGNSIIANSPNVIWQFLALAAIAIVTYTVGNVYFKKKDLPL